MTYTDRDYLIQLARGEEFRRQAEQFRRFRDAGNYPPHRSSPTRMLVNHIGCIMIRWGQKLQCYGAVPTPEHP